MMGTHKATSIRSRLATMMALLFISAIVGLYVAASSYADFAADRSYDRLLFGSALSIMDTLSITQGEVQVDLPYASLDMLSAAPDDKVFYRVVGPSGVTVTGYPDLPPVPGGFRTNAESSPQRGNFFDASYRGEPVRFVVIGRQIAQPGAKGWVWTQVGQTKLARNALAHQLVLNSLLPIMVVTILALALVWLGIGRALRPLEEVGREIGDREPADLSPIVTAVPAEIAPVIEAMNGFMRRLEGNIEGLRTFLADAAHQVRTPLAALLAQVQVASDARVEPQELRGRLAAVQRNAEKLSRLANQLLSDATVRHRAEVAQSEEFDLRQTVQQAISETVPLSEDSDVRFTSTLKQAPYCGDGLILCEAVKNLIHNALRHSGGAEPDVRISLKRTDEGYVLTVADRGPGIPDSEKQGVFERFARGSSKQPGSGLGLSIVRQAVLSHSGTITLHDRKGGGLTVEVCLPETRP
jgi:two-component system sensor histidine kinase TctE